MNFEQRPYRTSEADESLGESWLADDVSDDESDLDTFASAADDRGWRSSGGASVVYHVVVEDIFADYVMFGVAPWPTLDTSGRLQFGDLDEYPPGIADAAAPTVTYLLAAAQQAVDESREQPRPLRIGDVFRVETETFVDLNDWISATDVSSQAREAAKIAQRAAAQQAADMNTAEVLSLAPPSDDATDTDTDSGEFGPYTIPPGV